MKIRLSAITYIDQEDFTDFERDVHARGCVLACTVLTFRIATSV